MSAATFRRLGKIEQAKGAIQEAEVKDEGNPGVWVQVSTLRYFSTGFICEMLIVWCVGVTWWCSWDYIISR